MWVSTRIAKGEVKGGVYIFRTIFISVLFISFNFLQGGNGDIC
jgi:hypothetical protein